MRILKHIAKILLWTIISLFALIVLAVVLLQIPAVQQKLTGKVVAKVSERIGLQIEVGKVYPIFWDGIVLKDVCVHGTQNDTILSADDIAVSINSLNLDSSYVALSRVSLVRPQVWVSVDSAGKMNIAPLLELFNSSDTTSNFVVKVEDISIKDGQFSYNDFRENQSEEFGVNFSNLKVSELYLQAHDFSMNDGEYAAAIDKFSCKEQSDLQIQYLHGNFKVNDKLIRGEEFVLYTPKSKLSVRDVSLAYDSFSDFSSFCESVNMAAHFNRSTVSLYDISLFAPALKDIPYDFSLEGDFNGTVSDFSVTDLHIGYGRSSQFVGTLTAQGLPEIDSTSFSVVAQKIVTNQFDLSHTRIPPFNEEVYVAIPDALKNITYCMFSGELGGTIYNLTARGKIETNAGDIVTNARLKRAAVNQCVGEIALKNVDLAKISDSDMFGKTSASFTVDGTFSSDSLIEAMIKGNIDEIECNQYKYVDIDVDGKISSRRFFGKVNVVDPNLDMKFVGGLDMSNPLPMFRFKADVNQANLDALNFIDDSLSSLSFSTKVDFTGLKLDDMNGDIAIYDARYSNARGDVSTKNIALNVSNEDKQRKIKLHSSFVDASVEGSGSYADLFSKVKSTIAQHITAIPQEKKKNLQVPDFKVNVDVKNLNNIFALLQPELNIASGTKCEAIYKKESELCEFSVQSPQLTYNNVNLYKCRLNGDIAAGGMHVDLKGMLDSASNNVELIGSVVRDSVKLNANWNYNTMLRTFGKLVVDGKLQTKKVGEIPKMLFAVKPSTMSVNDSLWNIGEATIVVDTTSISLTNVSLFRNDRKIMVDGVISENKDDYVVLNVENYDLADLNPIINNERVRLSGPLEGRVQVKNVYKTPLVFADINSSHFSFNDNELGKLKLQSFWENKAKALLMRFSVQNGEDAVIAAEGKYVPSSDSVAYKVNCNSLHLDYFSEILEGVVNDMKGVLDGEISISGTLNNMSLSGELLAENGSFTVDYTKVPYTFGGKLRARGTRFFFSDFLLHDQANNEGEVRGFIDLKELPNILYLFDLQTPKLLAMNTTMQDNEYFYGTVYFNGMAKIEGDLNETAISCEGKSLENTVCSIPVTYSELTGAYDFLLFSSDTIQTHTYEKVSSSSSISIDMTLDLTPDALAQIVFDPKVGDAIKARGRGNLQIKMDKGGDLKVYGRYQIEEGDYLFTLKNLINKKLILEKGGTIVWNGDPLNAQVDLTANYETKASPQPLMDSSSSAAKRIPVTCQAHLKNNLLSPDISYDIIVPSSATHVSEVLATLSEDEKTLQFFSLMLQSAFVPINSDVTTGGSVSLEVLSNQFSNMLSQIDPNLDLNVNYRIATDNSMSNEFEFGFSRQFWNDRILVNVNGYTDFGASESTPTNAEQTQTSDFSGTVSVEMKVNKRGTIKVKGFSRSNEDELTEKQENTNGVGFFFTKDFNTLKDLFRKQEEN